MKFEQGKFLNCMGGSSPPVRVCLLYCQWLQLQYQYEVLQVTYTN